MYAKFITLCLLLVICHFCDINPNKKPLIFEQPNLLKKTQNGEKLLLGSLEDPEQNYIYIAKVKGTPYEMGKAFGELFQ